MSYAVQDNFQTFCLSFGLYPNIKLRSFTNLSEKRVTFPERAEVFCDLNCCYYYTSRWLCRFQLTSKNSAFWYFQATITTLQNFYTAGLYNGTFCFNNSHDSLLNSYSDAILKYHWSICIIKRGSNLCKYMMSIECSAQFHRSSFEPYPTAWHIKNVVWLTNELSLSTIVALDCSK